MYSHSFFSIIGTNIFPRIEKKEKEIEKLKTQVKTAKGMFCRSIRRNCIDSFLLLAISCLLNGLDDVLRNNLYVF